MHHRTVEQLAAADGPVHRLDPRIKLVCALGFVVVVAVLPGRLTNFGLPAAIVLAGLLAARLPWGFVLSRTLMVLPFVAMVAIFLPFTRGDQVIWSLGASGIKIYREGLELCLIILCKGVLAILAVEWLVFTTRFNRLLVALRSLKVPRVIVVTLAFLFRYLDLLADQSLRMRRARNSRTPGQPVRWRWRSTGGMIGQLLVRAMDRADRVHRAMVARGFDGEVRILVSFKLRKVDFVFLIGSVFLLSAVIVVGQLVGGLK
jgi:cobalt ECF transporter T component CbiQ